MQTWCERNNIINEAQAGFRPGYSTVDHIFVLQAIVTKFSGKRKGRFYCIFIDFSKAFDTLKHTVLLDSLYKAGVSEKFIKIISSMYNSLSASVRTAQGLSKSFPCTIGTRQGCTLSPQIFIIFINYLYTLMEEFGGQGIFISPDVNNLFALMFADDVSAVAGSCNQLQQKINALELYIL